MFMRCIKLAAGFLLLFSFIAINSPAYSAAACKGKNASDPGCPGAATEPPAEEEAAVDPAVVDNATVDWFNQKIVLRGSGFTGTTQFILGGSSPLTPVSVADTVVELNFDTALAGVVDQAGNYVLKVDGASVLSLFLKSEIVDPGATGCPCDSAWITELSAEGLWAQSDTTQCLEIPGPGTNDLADIAGTILSIPGDSSAPQYPIGAAFVPGDPVSSVCRLVRVNSDGSQNDLVNQRINEGQQASCAVTLKNNVCAASTP